VEVKILVKGVSVTYGSIKALSGVSVTLEEGQLASLVGPNGAGKTTLLKCISNILKPKVGTVLLDSTEISKISSKELAKKLGYVPQVQPTHIPLTVFEVVALGRRPHVTWRLSKHDLEVIWKVLKMVGVEHLADRYFDELSGGERQKVFIARALAQEPEVLLLDEPTNNLDLKHQLEILTLIRRLVKFHNLTVLMAMHDINLACRFSDIIIMLKDGKIFAIGEPSHVLTSENIKRVYGVEVAVINNPHLFIVPLRVSS